MADATTVGAPSAPVKLKSNARVLTVRALRTGRGRAGLLILLLVAGIAVVGPVVAPHSPSEVVGIPFNQPSSGAWLGTDWLGRDVFSRILYGGWVLLILATCATVLGVLVGGFAGLVSAYVGGKTEMVIMRLVDVLLALPQIIFALLLVSVVGPNPLLLVIAVGLSHAPQVARVLFAAAQDVAERDFVKISRLWGIGVSRVLRRDVMPNLLGPIMVEFGIRLSASIIMLAGLSFLGFGRQAPAPDWGVMVNENRLGIEVAPLGVAVPALLIALLAIGANTLGDSIARAALGDTGGEAASLEASLGTVLS